jgi:2-amino-4-hydroxy-6-hydroxymethyldihydropteridine diphosphokinase
MASDEDIPLFLGLGSNLGDREANLLEACRRIESLGVKITRSSSIYETEPVGMSEQPWFLNQVVEIAAQGIATAPVSWLKDIFESLQEIERKMGRERLVLNGPRVIDIDLLLFGDCNRAFKDSEDEGRECGSGNEWLIVPHPRMHVRRFVLEPLSEIVPDAIHPALGKAVRQLLEGLIDDSEVRLYRRS